MYFAHVIHPGLQTTIQDLGRWGLQARGVPVAGPMDPASHRIANMLVGNAPDAATLEVTLIGPELEFEDDRMVAVVGGEFELTVDGAAVSTNEPFHVHARSRLRFGARARGARAYVAVHGGIDTRPVFGSRATHLPSRMGGIDGRRLAAGDQLPLGGTTTAGKLVAVLEKDGVRPLFWRAVNVESNPTTGVTWLHGRVRVLPAPESGWFGSEGLGILQSTPFAITHESNRMGYRLAGTAIRDLRGRSMISDASPIGSVQIPPSGQPILLMADRQTTGGYPRLATVITADIGIAGQLSPGDSISFELTDPVNAVASLVAQERELTDIEARVS